MYWPIGAPRVYAVSAVGRTPAGLHAGSDETNESISEHDGAPVDDQDRKTNAQEHGDEIPDEDNPRAPLQKEKQAIIDLKVARQGHLFATITSDTLTIWQTQV